MLQLQFHHFEIYTLLEKLAKQGNTYRTVEVLCFKVKAKALPIPPNLERSNANADDGHELLAKEQVEAAKAKAAKAEADKFEAERRRQDAAGINSGLSDVPTIRLLSTAGDVARFRRLGLQR
ncbi:hypothetical protein SBOR_9107 [Sclerotinia borealis F-4128]|uniref:Uncharacterized protein n=1 Tax=Sclerotinia borealis (strain F-4128) TaxID=1432307 RepID=W9C3P7_SCLBF|nr:hypothetical protein SBOR_9107 [Sclerotinia borealis F-4128]